MVSPITIDHGNPVWLSPAIIPSDVVPIDTTTKPTWADPHYDSTNVDVYVCVRNSGAQVGCPIGPWTALGTAGGTEPAQFRGLRPANPGGSFTDTHPTNVCKFIVNSGGDTLVDSAGGTHPLHVATSGRKCWGWSPDARFFALAYELPKPDGSFDGLRWHLTVFALHKATRFNGATLVLGAPVLEYPPAGGLETFNLQFNQTNFGWVGSSAVFVRGLGTEATPQEHRYVACFRVPPPPAAPPTWTPPTYSESTTGGSILPTGGSTLVYFASPCGAQLAMARLPGPAGAPPAGLKMISTRDAALAPTLTNGGPLNATPLGTAYSMTTVRHSARGVNVDRDGGAGTIVQMDDPDGTETSGGLVVMVDRVKASTLPNANQDVRPVGVAGAGTVATGAYTWVQVPNATNWLNDGEEHWCLLAQVYDEAEGLARVWDGQPPVTNPPTLADPFPQPPTDPDNERCAQRNIYILNTP